LTRPTENRRTKSSRRQSRVQHTVPYTRCARAVILFRVTIIATRRYHVLMAIKNNNLPGGGIVLTFHARVGFKNDGKRNLFSFVQRAARPVMRIARMFTTGDNLGRTGYMQCFCCALRIAIDSPKTRPLECPKRSFVRSWIAAFGRQKVRV